MEVIEITYDPEQVSYEQLLDVFWVNVDPLDAGGQFCDRGESYSTAVFVANDDEHALVEQSIAAVEARLGQKVVTPIRQLNATGFTAAEGYHQDTT